MFLLHGTYMYYIYPTNSPVGGSFTPNFGACTSIGHYLVAIQAWGREDNLLLLFKAGKNLPVGYVPPVCKDIQYYHTISIQTWETLGYYLVKQEGGGGGVSNMHEMY